VRKSSAAKRGGGAKPVELSEESLIREDRQLELQEMLDELRLLSERDEQGAEILKLRMLGCMCRKEIAAELGVSVGTVESKDLFVRTWMSDRMEHDA